MPLLCCLGSLLYRARTTATKLTVFTDAPKLDELFSPNTPLNGLSHYFAADPTTPNKQTNYPAPSSGNSMRHIEHETPTRQQPADRVASPPASEADFYPNSPHTLSTIGTPTSELGSMPWSAAVGRAGTGKSGRVIEKLMGENDRLQRERKLATVKLEEEIKRGESARSALETLRVSNETLSSIHETDKVQMAKKDRKIESLRADLELEKLRREKAEKETRESRRERDETVEKIRRDAAEDKEEARRSAAQYEILSSSWKTMEDRYERQTQKLRADLKILRIEIDGDRQKLAQLEVILEQLAKEGQKTRRAKEKLSFEFQAYKAEQEAGILSIQERAEENDFRNDTLHSQMNSVLGQMKHVVNVERDTRGR